MDKFPGSMVPLLPGVKYCKKFFWGYVFGLTLYMQTEAWAQHHEQSVNLPNSLDKNGRLEIGFFSWVPSSAPFFCRGMTTSCVNLVGKQPVATYLLKNSAINGASRLLHFLKSHVSAGSRWHFLLGVALTNDQFLLQTAKHCVSSCLMWCSAEHTLTGCDKTK